MRLVLWFAEEEVLEFPSTRNTVSSSITESDVDLLAYERSEVEVTCVLECPRCTTRDIKGTILVEVPLEWSPIASSHITCVVGRNEYSTLLGKVRSFVESVIETELRSFSTGQVDLWSYQPSLALVASVILER
jgi:hypothetical protein